MERLTGRGCTGQAIIKKDKTYGLSNEDFTCYDGEEGLDLLQKVFDKLAEYEEAEEQGKLFQFPCKVGDTVFVLLFTKNNTRYCECAVEQIIINAGIVEINVLMKLEHIRSRLDINMFGKTIFFTQEEAEKALAELEQ